VLEHPAPVGQRRLGRPLLSRQDFANGCGFVLFLNCAECVADDVLRDAPGRKFPSDAQPASSLDRCGRANVRGCDAAIVEQAGRGQILNEDVDSIGLVLAVEQLLSEF